MNEKNIKNMSMSELESHLFSIAENESIYKHFPDQVEGIIHTIIKFYATNIGYYPEDAIRTFKKFLISGILEF